MSYGKCGSSPSRRTSYRSAGNRARRVAKAPSSASEPYPPTKSTSSFRLPTARGRSSGSVEGGGMLGVGTASVSISDGRSPLTGTGTAVAGCPTCAGAGGRPSSASAVTAPPTGRMASARSQARRRARPDTPGTQLASGISTNRTFGRYRGTAATLGSRAGDLRRLIACRLFGGIIERPELHVIVPARERPAQKTVREPGVLRQT